MGESAPVQIATQINDREVKISLGRSFCVTNIYPYGIVKLHKATTGRTFKVNGYHLRKFHKDIAEMIVERTILQDPIYPT